MGTRVHPSLGLVLALVACTAGDAGSRGTATLRWTAVTRGSDGAALTDLAGYRIYYGRSPNALNKTVVLADPKATSYVVKHLSRGTWYFTVAAYTKGGFEGHRSGVGSKTIP
jgi:hypothetical protein